MRTLRTATYHVWTAMRQRCTNPDNPGYKDWGGRGITVCARWDSYEAFLADMGEKPTGMFLDRRDNDGNYDVDNCRWATRAEQRRNCRDTRMITYAGITLCVKDWAIRAGIHPNTLYHRLDTGWDVARALTTKPKITGRPKRQVT